MRNFFLQIYKHGTFLWGDLVSLTMTHNIKIVYSLQGTFNACSYICGGDPSLEIWTSQPRLFQDVSCEIVSDSVILCSASIQDYMVSVVSDEGDCLACYKAIDGVCSFVKPTGNYYISILKHDYLPYVLYFNFDSDIIQNRQIKYNECYFRSPMDVGYDVSNNLPFGNVIVKSGGSLKIRNTNGTTIKNGFICEEGATMKIE